MTGAVDREKIENIDEGPVVLDHTIKVVILAKSIKDGVVTAEVREILELSQKCKAGG